MKKTYLLSAILLLSAVWVAAQQQPPAPRPADPNATQTSPATPQSSGPEQSAPASDATIQGCLAGSANSFTLTDKAGKVYQLDGDSAKLSPHVGHEIQVIGSQAAGGATSTDAPAVVTVKKIKMLASTCSTK